LEEYDSGYIAFGCGSADTILAIPVIDFAAWVDSLNIREPED
jgi:hypothetical protein